LSVPVVVVDLVDEKLKLARNLGQIIP
jgi:hypothetical protein